MKQENKTQADLARLIKRNRVRAHRIVHGLKPNDEEMELIFQASNGKVTPNDFYKLEDKHNNNKSSNVKRKVKKS